jgi:hypothetical protein
VRLRQAISVNPIARENTARANQIPFDGFMTDTSIGLTDKRCRSKFGGCARGGQPVSKATHMPHVTRVGFSVF